MESTKQLTYRNGDPASAAPNISGDTEIEDITDEEDIPIPYKYDISSFGADYPVDALVLRLNNGDIVVPTFGAYNSDEDQIRGFQRGYVWTRLKSDRFIESLLLGLPVPGIFLVRDVNNRLLVLDGQQRLRTLQRFYGKTEAKERKYHLRNVDSKFDGKSYDELDPTDRRRLDDSIIHATIVRQDEPTDNQSSIYDIFERLNTGGVNLRPQEIRVALYHGDLAQVLLELNEDPNWRFLYGKKSPRLKDLEMILRFFAFYYSGDEYSKPMKNFLNKYMGKNRDLECQSEDELKEVFGKTTASLKDLVGKDAFRPKGVLNAAVLDSVMTGVAKRIQHRPIENRQDVVRQLRDLFKNEKYLEAVTTGTSEDKKVRTRHELALEAFANIQ